MNVLTGTMKRLNGEPQDLSDFLGQVVLVVNTASKCGFTPQFEGLEALYKEHKDKGLSVLGFPCNQFAQQEKGEGEEIAAFCQKNYGVSFPMFDKIDVNGSNAAPFYKQLKQQAPGLLGSKAIKWNFTKFLINRQGQVVKRYAPTATPESIAKDVIELLG